MGYFIFSWTILLRNTVVVLWFVLPFCEHVFHIETNNNIYLIKYRDQKPYRTVATRLNDPRSILIKRIHCTLAKLHFNECIQLDTKWLLLKRNFKISEEKKKDSMQLFRNPSAIEAKNINSTAENSKNCIYLPKIISTNDNWFKQIVVLLVFVYGTFCEGTAARFIHQTAQWKKQQISWVTTQIENMQTEKIVVKQFVRGCAVSNTHIDYVCIVYGWRLFNRRYV